MINLLRKCFIKDYKNVTNPKVRKAHGVLASVGGIILNLILFVIKIVVGIFTFSISIISDAINNLTDFFSCIVNLIGFKAAAKPADKNHPYGHERIEYISGLIISFVIVIAGVILGYTSISSLILQDAKVAINIATFIILSISIVIKIFLGFYYYKIGKLINSVSLKAAMKDSFLDSLITSGVLVTSLFQYYFKDIWFLDASVSLIISLFILYSGIKMVIETITPLIGAAPDKELVLKIKEMILSQEGVLGIHDLIFHSYGPTKCFMTFHLEVDGYANPFATHELADDIEMMIKEKFNVIATAHVDPVDIKSEELKNISLIIKKALNDLDTSLSMHDLRIVKGITVQKLLFDVVLPEKKNYTTKDIETKIENYIKKENLDYQIVINFDENYI